MDWAAQLQILRRGGLKSGPSLTEAQVVEQMEAIRKTQASKTKEMVEEGKRAKKVGDNENSKNQQSSPDQKVGQTPPDQTEPSLEDESSEAPPLELTGINPTDQEQEMAELLKGPDFSLYEDVDAGKVKRTVTLEPGKFDEQAKPRLAHMSSIDQQGLTEG